MPKKIFNSDLETSGSIKANLAKIPALETDYLASSVEEAPLIRLDGFDVNIGTAASPVANFNVHSDGGEVNIPGGTLSVGYCTISGTDITGVNAHFQGNLDAGYGIVDCNAISTSLVIGNDYPAAAPTTYGFIRLPDTREDTTNTSTELEIAVAHYQGIAEVAEGEGSIRLESRGRSDTANQTTSIDINSTDGITLSATKGNVQILTDITGGGNNEVVIREKIGIKRDLGSGHTESSRYPYLEAQLNETVNDIERWDLYITAGTSTDETGGSVANTVILDNKKISIGHVDDPFITFDDGELVQSDKIKFIKGASFENALSIEGSLNIPSITVEPDTLSTPTTSTHDLVIHATNPGSPATDPTYRVFRASSTAFSGLHNYIAEDSSGLSVGDVVGLVNNRLVHLEANSTAAVGILVSPTYDDHVRTSLGETESPENCTVYYTASVGDSRARGCMGFNVCNENGDIQPGDLLVTSSTPGYLMKQDDDIIRAKTVGKAMEAVTFDSNGRATGVYGFIYCG